LKIYVVKLKLNYLDLVESNYCEITDGNMKRIFWYNTYMVFFCADDIHVRVYEERMDLLRACIVGAAGTPYHDNIFFFDIFFPPAYPHEPPVSYSLLWLFCVSFSRDRLAAEQ
jgi:hypothetical protein